MDRRKFFQAGLAAAFAAQLTSDLLTGQTPAAEVKGAGKLRVDIDSKHLQWLRTAGEVADAANEMNFAGVDLTVGPHPAHLDPAKVTTDLAPFVNTLRKQGLEVISISSPIQDADLPNAEALLSAAHGAGLTHYSWGGLKYEEGKPVQPQLDALKPRLEKLAKLNEKYKMKGLYHATAGTTSVGAAVWDLLSVLKNFDPALLGFQFDLGEMAIAGSGGTWALNMRAAGPYIGGVSLKDNVLETTFAVHGGGPFTGQPAAAGGRGGGRGRGAPGASGGGGGFGGPPDDFAGGPGFGGGAPGASGGRGGRGGGGGRGGPGGGTAGSVRGAVAAPPWHDRPVPLGTGMAGLSIMGGILKEINFSGPVVLRAEYPNGGAENGDDHITLPREQVLGSMKRDLLSARAAWASTGLL